MVRLQYTTGDKEVKLDFNPYFILLALMVLGFSAGYINSDLKGGLAGIVISIILMVISLVGLVPVAGPFIYWYLSGELPDWLPSIASLLGGEGFGILRWITLLLAIASTVFTTVALIILLRMRRWERRRTRW